MTGVGYLTDREVRIGVVGQVGTSKRPSRGSTVEDEGGGTSTQAEGRRRSVPEETRGLGKVE